MSQLEYSEIREKKIIIHDDEPCEVVESHVARTQQRKPQNQVKLRSLISGKVFPATYHVSESANEADVSKREVMFLYHNKGEYWFCAPEDRGNRFKLDSALVGNSSKFLKENGNVTALVWTNDEDEEKVIKLSLPIKMNFKVKEAPPAVRGDTSKGGIKVVNTENGEYVERV